MAQGDLTTVGNVKLWLGITSSTSDALLGRLISAVSGLVRGYLSRPYLGSTLVTERVNGHGRDTLTLRHGPVTKVVSIAYDGATVTTAATGNPPTGGYLIDPMPDTVGRITLTDDVFPRGRLNVQVTYWAGYQVAGETYTAAAAVQAASTWLTDAGVTYANGTALTAVTGAPTAGQYAVSSGVYTFAAADYGATVLLTYGSPPADLEQAVVDLVGEAFKRPDRIGLITKTLGGQEVITFSQKAMTAPPMLALARFMRTSPVG